MAEISNLQLQDPKQSPGRTGKPDNLSLEFFDIPLSRQVQGNAFPLGLKAGSNSSSTSLEDFLKRIEDLADRGLFRELLQKHGAILFRGLPIRTANDLSKFTKAFKYPQPHQEVGLSGKRSTVGDNVKTANEAPPHIKFYYHDEYGRSAHFPEIQFFSSQVVPEQGGQSPLPATVELYERLVQETPEVVQTLIEKGGTGRQYYPSKTDHEALTIGWNWQDSYGFAIEAGDPLETQRSKVEDVLRTRRAAKAEWQPNGALHVLQTLSAIRKVESTGQVVPFNGLGGVYGRQRDRGALEPPHRGIDGNYHFSTTYGDGTEIPREYLDKLLEISDDIGFLVPWQEGDVALIDNYTVQHARSPWVGKRSLLVSLWDGHEKFVPLKSQKLAA